MATETRGGEVAVEGPPIKDQAEKVLAQIAGYVGARTIEIGLRRGLIEALAAQPEGITAGELAARTRLDPFYGEVWCRSALAQEILQRAGDGAYRLAPHMDTLLLDGESPAYVGGTIAVLVQPEVFDRFSEALPTGSGPGGTAAGRTSSRAWPRPAGPSTSA